jgi:putative hydrolase of the HAD superfamily
VTFAGLAASFDLDGTLGDHATAVDTSFEAAAALLAPDARVSADALRADFAAAGARLKAAADAAGDPCWDVRRQWELATAAQGLRLSNADLDRITERFTGCVSRSVRAFPEARATLRALRQHGVRIGILTNGDPGIQRTKIRRMGLAELAQAIVVSGELGAHKPDPAAFAAIAAALETEVAGIVHIGDDFVHDYQGALHAGAHAVWIDRAGAAPGGPHDQPPACLPAGIRVEQLSDIPPLWRAGSCHRRP